MSAGGLHRRAPGVHALRARLALPAALLLLATLLPLDAAAAGAAKAEACAALSRLPLLKDVGVLSMDMRARRGRCEVEVQAGSLPALRRQQTVVEAMTRAACGQAPALSLGNQVAPTLYSLLPARCSTGRITTLFGEDASTWNPPPVRSPRYPSAAAKDGLQGRSIVAMLIDTEGKVVAAIVRGSSGHAVLDAAAIAEVHTWRFTRADPAVPPPVLSVAQVPVTYVLD
ncbi:TonB family protein [Stenotrophomonas sp.]|uniref:energy transducer TonB n=1 Tax=Stenotrophomonas sp. TaxID=69392 RepID=UPI002FC6247B